MFTIVALRKEGEVMFCICRADVHNSVQDIIVIFVFYSFIFCALWDMEAFSRLDDYSTNFYLAGSVIVVITGVSEVSRWTKSAPAFIVGSMEIPVLLVLKVIPRFGRISFTIASINEPTRVAVIIITNPVILIVFTSFNISLSFVVLNVHALVVHIIFLSTHNTSYISCRIRKGRGHWDKSS